MANHLNNKKKGIVL